MQNPDGKFTTIETALKRLDLLDAGEVAELFKAIGVTGVPHSPCFCPVAKYIWQETGKAARVAFTITRVYSVSEEVYSYSASEETHGEAELEYTLHTLPSEVTRFIQKFDRGEFPGLEEKIDSASY